LQALAHHHLPAAALGAVVWQRDRHTRPQLHDAREALSAVHAIAAGLVQRGVLLEQQVESAGGLRCNDRGRGHSVPHLSILLAVTDQATVRCSLAPNSSQQASSQQ
jgi:hypothetical protein